MESKLRIAIVEDQRDDANNLYNSAVSFGRDIKINLDPQCYSSGETFMADHPEKYDIIFLDIFLYALTGIEVAQQMRERLSSKAEIIFVTSSSEYALKGFEFDAAHYIVKPYSELDFKEAMHRAIKKLCKESYYIKIKSGRELRKISHKDIKYIDYYSHAVQIHTNTEIIRSYVMFKDVEQGLKAYTNFILCFRNIVVNMDAVISIGHHSFTLEEGIEIPINRKRYGEIKKEYINYKFSQMRL